MHRNSILWADDDADDLQMVREILLQSENDFDIIEVNNGKDAIRYLDQAKQKTALPCLIILDINMPVMDGKETLSIIKANEAYREIPVVVFTTSDSEMDKLFCRRMKTEMITKPPSFSSLQETITRLLNSYKWRC
jgi:CheY-like chemotaxis protein